MLSKNSRKEPKIIYNACFYCGAVGITANMTNVPKNAETMVIWRQWFGVHFFSHLRTLPKAKRNICKRHIIGMNSFLLKNGEAEENTLGKPKMEDQKLFDMQDVKSEEVGEEKPPILAPPPTIPFYRGPPPPKQRRIYRYDNNPSTSDFTPHYSSVEGFNEELSMRFLFGNGLPLSRIEDEHFQSFLLQLNPNRAPPEAIHLATKASVEIRKLPYLRKRMLRHSVLPILAHILSTPMEDISGPLNVTIEAIRKNDEVFLTISVHYYGSDGERKNFVHFEKIILADYEGRVVADRLRRVIDPKRTYRHNISNILSPNIRMVQLLAENTKFKNTFVCFFSYLSNIAREVIMIAEFSSALKTLKRFVETLRKSPEVLIKFKRMRQSTNSPQIDIPALDVPPDWLTTLHFLTTCGQLNETFGALNEGWCLPEYLTQSEENALANLTDFLTVLCHVATEISSEDSCVSQVLYSMSIVNNAIENCGIRTVRSGMRSVFNKYFQSLSTGQIGNFYSISALLDPRFGYSDMIFSEEDWANVELKLINNISILGVENLRQKQQQIRTNIGRYKYMMKNDRPVFDDVLTPSRWWNSMADELPILRKKWIEYSSLPAVSVDGKRFFGKGGKLAHLFAGLDEVLHHKATLLAQSSQNFVGRGNASKLVLEQIRYVAETFRRLDDEPDEDVEPEVKTEVVGGAEDVVVKEEAPEDEQDLREVKLEEPDDI